MIGRVIVKMVGVLFFAFWVVGCGGSSSPESNVQNNTNTIPSEKIQKPQTPANSTNTPEQNSTQKSEEPDYTPEEVDGKVEKRFGIDTTVQKLSKDENVLAGNWYGKKDYMSVTLQLRKDGTYSYHSTLGIGKYHNYYRYSDYNGTWQLSKGNAQVILSLPNVEAPLILTNHFPTLQSPAGITLFAGDGVDTSAEIAIDASEDHVDAAYTDKAKTYLKRKVADFQVDYFTMVAPKANSEAYWGNVTPPGYNYGHKLGLGSDDWNYALERIKNDPKNYTMVISDEHWQTMLGNRAKYASVIQEPEKMYRWFEYFKDQMQILGQVPGTVLYIIAGDAPAYWAGNIRDKHGNDPKNVPAKLIESRFPEVLERNPHNSFAGVFQMMDYLRMKYAPNVKLGYTIKTWGIGANPFSEPAEGWDDNSAVQALADYLNNYDVQFDSLSFNFNPRSPSYTVEQYKSGTKFFGAVSKKLKTRDGSKPKMWIWKVSLWNKEHTTFFFQNIRFLVDECNAIGMTLGHGNDLVKAGSFKDDPDAGIFIKSWISEYFNGKQVDGIPVHGTVGIVPWR